MSTSILVDSNFYIDRARQGLDPFADLAQANPDWEITTCGMVMVEVLRGVRHPRALERFATAFSVMVCVPSTGTVWERAWRLAWEMDRAGKVIPGQDLVIAAHALYAGAAVLSADHHFRQIPGLEVLNRLD
jgi:predicted nucleic acid-binding protein